MCTTTLIHEDYFEKDNRFLHFIQLFFCFFHFLNLSPFGQITLTFLQIFWGGISKMIRRVCCGLEWWGLWRKLIVSEPGDIISTADSYLCYFFVCLKTLRWDNLYLRVIWISVHSLYSVWVESVQDTEDLLNEAETKLDGVRQKIGQIAEELRGEDIYQFHRAFTPGKFPQTCFLTNKNVKTSVAVLFLYNIAVLHGTSRT